MKESIQRAFTYLQAKKIAFSIGHEVDSSDFHVEVIDLLGNQVEAEVGRGVLRGRFLRDSSRPSPGRNARARRHEHPGQHQGRPLARRAAPGRDGQRRRCALIPAENKRSFLEVNTDVIDKIDPIFYNDVKTATFKALDLS